jgi:hypothetical protein
MKIGTVLKSDSYGLNFRLIKESREILNKEISEILGVSNNLDSFLFMYCMANGSVMVEIRNPYPTKRVSVPMWQEILNNFFIPRYPVKYITLLQVDGFETIFRFAVVLRNIPTWDSYYALKENVELFL